MRRRGVKGRRRVDGRPRAHFVTIKDTERANGCRRRPAGASRAAIARGLTGSAGASVDVANYCFGALRRRTVTDWTVCGAISTVSEDAAGFRPSFGAMEITA